MTAAAEVVPVADAAYARNLTDKIKVAVEGTWQLITEAYTSRAWAALGYSSWDDYCTREFGTSRLRLPREERQEVVSSLRDQGLSLRAIAAVTGNSEPTIRRVLAGASNDAPAQPTVEESDDEPSGPDEFAPEPAASGELARSDRHGIQPEAVVRAEPAPTSPTVTGTDGKTYSATAAPTRAQYRKPLPEVAKSAGWELRRAMERVEKVFDDMSQRDVNRYAAAMARGEWLVTGEAVKFAHSGELLDGQHRLAAIIQSGKTVPLLVVRGLHQSVQDVLDTGRARTAADQLSIHGFTNPTLLAAAAKIAILYESGLFYRDRSLQSAVSHRQILDYCAGNPTLAFAVARGHSYAKSAELQPSVAAMTFYELVKLNDEKAIEFFDRLSDGVNLPAGSAILALRARLRQMRDDRVQLPVEAKVGLVFRTWNAWLAGRKLTALPLYRQGELIQCPEPKSA